MSGTYTAIVIDVILVIVSILLLIIVSTVISGRIVRPIKACADRLVLLSEGDLKAAVPVINSKDETAILSNSTKKIVESMRAIIDDETEALESMADGNFDVHTQDALYPGDFHQLCVSIHDINNKLSRTLKEINVAADQVSSGSDQVSSGTQALSQGATEQASSVEELAATINEITSEIQKNAEFASNANATAVGAGEMLLSTMNMMDELVSAMQDINKSSDEISRFIKTIEDIAFQTNILALNAAVEAARAGAAGKGFTIVANEVRNLASKSGEAAKNTSSLIERSLRAVENGTRIVNETSESIKKTAESAKAAVSSIGSITESSKYQADAIQQVSVGIDKISSVIQTNSATAQQSVAEIQQLSGQAQMLKNLVGSFKLRDTEPSESTSYYDYSNSYENNYQQGSNFESDKY